MSIYLGNQKVSPLTVVEKEKESYLAAVFNGTITEINEEVLKGCTKLPFSVFSGNNNLITAIIPDTITYMGAAIFDNCKKLKNVRLPNTIKTIYNQTFAGCSSLEEITIPASVETFKNTYAPFHSCTALKKIIIKHEGVIPIEKDTFYNCPAIEKIIVPIGYGEAYKTATNWSNWASYIEEATE